MEVGCKEMMESAISKPLVSIIVPVYNVEHYIKTLRGFPAGTDAAEY